jgi:hypothetical protein
VTRQSIVFEGGWVRGSSPRMTEQGSQAEVRHAKMEHDH